MQRFFDSHLAPAFDAVRVRSIVEVGAGEGGNTRQLIAYCAAVGARLDVIELSPSPQVRALEADLSAVGTLRIGYSTDLIGDTCADVYLLDGDHNWFTVLTELREIDAVARRNGAAFPLVFLHDVGWPYGLRDQYCGPEVIPDEAKHPMASWGVEPGSSALVPDGGLNRGYLQARHEGGPRNGVLCAVRDFIAESERSLTFHTNPAFHGLGILYAAAELGADAVARLEPIVTLDERLRGVIEQLEATRVASLIADVNRPRCLSLARVRKLVRRLWVSSTGTQNGA